MVEYIRFYNFISNYLGYKLWKLNKVTNEYFISRWKIVYLVIMMTFFGHHVCGELSEFINISQSNSLVYATVWSYPMLSGNFVSYCLVMISASSAKKYTTLLNSTLYKNLIENFERYGSNKFYKKQVLFCFACTLLSVLWDILVYSHSNHDYRTSQFPTYLVFRQSFFWYNNHTISMFYMSITKLRCGIKTMVADLERISDKEHSGHMFMVMDFRRKRRYGNWGCVVSDTPQKINMVSFCYKSA